MIGAATYWITFGQITTTFFNKPINQFLVMRVGALIGTIVDNFTVPLDSKKSHIIPLGVILIMPGIIATGLFFLPDSPRWLLQTNKEDEARTALKCLPPYPELVDGELVNMELAIDTEAELARSAEIVDLWRDPIDRRRALLAIGTISLQPASGASYIIVYSTYFFEMADLGSPFQNTCIMSGIGSFVLVVNSLIITKYGLFRVFLSWGMVFCGLSQLIMAAVYTAHSGTILTGKVKLFLES